MCIVARTINAPLGAPISYYRAPNNVIDQVSGHLVPFWKFWSKSGPNSLFLSKRSEFSAQSVVVPEKVVPEDVSFWSLRGGVLHTNTRINYRRPNIKKEAMSGF